MSIEERLNALTQSLELLGHIQRENDRRHEQMREDYDRRFAEIARTHQVHEQLFGQIVLQFHESQRENERRFAEIANQQRENAMQQQSNERRFAEISRTFQREHESIKSLEAVALAHQQRLDEMEGE